MLANLLSLIILPLLLFGIATESLAVKKFGSPIPVHIKGLPMGAGNTPISTEEPFITRDGRFLFFNTGKKENSKDMHYAKNIAGDWLYQGEVGPGVNTKKEVEGNPSMDSNNNFFFINSGIDPMISRAKFSPVNGTLSEVNNFDVVPLRKVKLFAQKIHGNMGVEASIDGGIIFFSRATWDLNGLALGDLLESNILFVERQNNSYVFNESEAKHVMKEINTQDLEYAASISSDGLELFFTRFLIKDFEKKKIRSMIMRATRRVISEPFGKPEIIKPIGRSDFVEGPAISGDGKELYYHRFENKKFRIYKVTR